MSERHIPIDVRRRIGVSPGAVGGMWVRFGQDSPLDGPGGYNYEISPEDRDVFEQAIEDANSSDSVLRDAALSGLGNALKGVAGTVGPIGLLGLAGAQIINFLGFGTEATGSLSDGAVIGHGYFYSSPPTGEDGSAGIGTGHGAVIVRSLSVSNGVATLKVTRYPIDPYSYLEDTFQNRWATGYATGYVGVFAEGAAEYSTGNPYWSSGTSSSGWFDASSPEEALDLWFAADANDRVDDYEQSAELSAGQYQLCSYDVLADDSNANHSCKAPFSSEDDFAVEPPTADLEGMEPIGDLDPALSDVTPAEMQDMIDAIKDSPYGQDYYEPPVDTQDPSDMPIPAPDPTPEPGAGEIPAPSPISPGAGGGAPIDNFTYDDTIGQSPLAEFGMPMGDDFFDPDTGQLGDAFRPGKPFQGNVGGTPFPGTINAVKPVKPPRGAGGGLSGPGGIPALDPPNADFTGTAPPFYGDTFRKDRCFNDRLVTDVVKILAGELGLNANNIYVTPGCDKRFTGCFKKGTSKFDAMWDLADRCGYGVFPGPGDGGTVEPVTPLPVHHGPYHELVDLFRFEPVYDDFETYAYVEVSRPHYPGKRGYSVVVPVNSVYSVSEDKVYTQIVGRNYPEADAMDRAVKLAENFRRRTMQIECAIPYDPAIKLRHQFKVQRPSYRFDANYMATTVRHDCNHEGYITVLAGTYLTPEESAQYA